MSAQTEQTHRINPMLEGTLFHGTFAPGPHNVEQVVFTLAEPVDAGAFAQAWQKIADRHPLLRAGFRQEAGRAQFVDGPVEADVTTLDWRGLADDTARERLLEEFLHADRARDFDPANPPLFRVTLIHWHGDICRVVWSLQRALLDSRSLSMLLREWWNCHGTIMRGGDSGDVPAPLGSGLPVWPPDGAGIFAGGTDTTFWREYLHDFGGPTSVELPGPPPERAERQPGDICCIEHRLDIARSDAIRRLAKAAGVTLNNLAQAAWALLLFHYSGSADVVFGITRCCRRSGPPGMEDAVGPFVNVIPLRAKIHDENNVFELLWQLRDQHRSVREHECSSLAQVQRSAGLGEDEWLFDTLFEFDQRDPMAALQELFPPSGPRDFRHYAGTHHGLHLQMYGENALVLRLKYRHRQYDAPVVARMLDHYASLLAGMAQEPWQRVKDVPYLSDEDRAPCVWPETWPAPQPDGQPGSLHGRFQEQARQTPDRIAVSCGGARMTYAELNRAANRLARRLRAAGALPDTVIGLFAERSIEQLVGALGILKSGAGYLPLDPAYPRERLSFLIQDAGARIVVAPAVLHERLPERKFALLEPVTGEDAGPDTDVDAAVDVSGGADDLAYVIHTSGSTGQPKGVMVTHRNVTRLFDACQPWLRAGPEDVWSLFHSFAFDFSVWETWGALLHGGRLEIVPADVARTPEAFYALLADRGVTVLSQTPSAFMQLQKIDAAQRRALPALRLVVFGGERLDMRELRDWVERHGDTRPQLVNMYGITETTVHVTYRPVSCADTLSADAAYIGWPLPDLQVRLLDRDGRPVPPGVRGEIYVGGAGVARGYLNRPALNAERFIRDEASGVRFYRSGDFARRMPDGELCYLGREDAQVKIRGYRIDLGEIAYALRRLPGVIDGIVVPRANPQEDGQRLIAYYVADMSLVTIDRTDADSMEKRLREQLAAQLPPWMLPAALVRLPRIPMNGNNKVDIQALPGPGGGVAGLAAEPPATPVESALAAIWTDVLERPGIGRDADFFSLGGDSILVLQTVSRARACGIEITPRDVFEHTTLAALARVARQVPTMQRNEETAVKPQGHCALTPIQRWFFEQSFENPDYWNQAFLFRVPSECDVDLLERACFAVMSHHDALNLRFVREHRGQGHWRAEYGDPADAFEFSRVELDHLGEDERREAVELITREILNSLSLSSGLLVRVAHFSGGLEDGNRLLIAIHHLAIDAASWGIVLQDIDTVYRVLAAGREPVLPRRTTSYGTWAAQLEKHAASSSVAAERAFWDEVMASDPGTRLWPAVAGLEADARTCRIALEASETAALLGGANRAYGTDPHELFIAGLARACADQWPAAPALRIDVEHHGRDHDFAHIDLSRTVGWFTTQHPLVLDLYKARNPARSIYDVKTRLRSAPHHGIGWGLLRYLRPGMPLAAQGRSRILFTHLGRFERLLGSGLFQFANEDTGSWRAPENHLTHDLQITGSVRDDCLEFEFRYNAKALAEDVVESLAFKYACALRQIIQHCRSREKAARTPADFPLARVTQEELDVFPADLQHVEDILPLTPIQRLYHALSGTDRDVGFDQWIFHLRGSIDEAAFEEAWRELFRRHDVLRSAFVDRGLAEAHQVIFRRVDFRMQRTDWRLLSEDEQAQRLREFLEADRREGFDSAIAPLTRATLIRAGDDRWILVWSHHQAQVDGWSWPILARELGEIHDVLRAGQRPQLEPPGSYRSYITWLANRDLTEYARFWRTHLGTGRMARSLISKCRRNGDGRRGPRRVAQVHVELGGELSAGIGQLARALRLTPSVVFQAAWALLLSALTTRFDVTLGVAFSGRTAGIPVPDNTVGPFVNNLPVRVRISPTVRVDRWLANMRGMQADLNHFQNAAPAEVHAWSGNTRAGRLFDTLLVFQNYAAGAAARRWGEHIRVTDFSAGVHTNYPLTVAVTPGGQYEVDFVYDENLIDRDTVQTLGRHLVTILTTLSRSPDVRIDTILKHVTEPLTPNVRHLPEQRLSQWRRRAGDRAPAGATRADGAPERVERNSLAGRIATVCREVLDVPAIRLEQNFFDIGAQSMSLLEIHRRLQEELQRAFPIVKLFQHPSVAELARYLERGDPDGGLLDASRRGAAQRASLQRWQPEIRS